MLRFEQGLRMVIGFRRAVVSYLGFRGPSAAPFSRYSYQHYCMCDYSYKCIVHAGTLSWVLALVE